MRRIAHTGWSLLTVALFAGGCAKLPEELPALPAGEQAGLVIRASQGADSRTMPGEPGDGTPGSEQPVCWSADDAFALWAVDGASGALQLDGTRFRLRNYGSTFETADFLATAAPMPAGSYTYYAFYPFDAVRAGSTVTAGEPEFRFEVPAVQHGDYDAAADMMYATVTGRDLPAIGSSYTYPDGTPLDDEGWALPQLRFRHLTHLLRIRIVTSALEQPINRIDIAFPAGTAAAGTAAFYPDSERVVSEAGSNIVTLRLEEPIEAGADRYLWIHLLPCELPEQSQIKFRAYDEAGFPSELMRATIVGVEGRTLASGHVSPVSLNPQKLTPKAVTLRCPDTNEYPDFLGETATKLTITQWPEQPVAQPLEAANGLPYELPLDAEGRGTLHFYYDSEEPVAQLDPQDALTIGAFESEHAALRFDLPAIGYRMDFASLKRYGELYFALPYLLFEDFSGLSSSFEYYTEHTTSDATNHTPITLDEYGLPGWTGTRVGGEAAVGLRIQSRVEAGLGIANRMYGRTESAPLSALKEGSSVEAKALFDYAGARYNATGGDSGDVLLSFGYTTTQGTIAAGTAISNALITDQAIDIDFQYDGTHYGNTPHTITPQTIPDCTPQTRLSWKVYNNRAGALAANGCYWLYIDNVKVSIGGEVRHPDLDYRSFFPTEASAIE